MKLSMTPKQKKITIGVVSVAALLGIGLLVSSKKDNTSTTTDPTGNGSVSPVSFNAQKVADELYRICAKTGKASFLNIGQTEEIFSILKTVSATQFAQVMTKFGKRPYNRFWNNNYFLIGTEPSYHPLNVILKDELWSEDYAILKKKYPNSL